MNMMLLSDALPDHLIERMFAPDEQSWKQEAAGDAMEPAIRPGDVLWIAPCYAYEGPRIYLLRAPYQDPKGGSVCETVCRVELPWLTFDNPICAGLRKRMDRASCEEAVIGRVRWLTGRM